MEKVKKCPTDLFVSILYGGLPVLVSSDLYGLLLRSTSDQLSKNTILRKVVT